MQGRKITCDTPPRTLCCTSKAHCDNGGIVGHPDTGHNPRCSLHTGWMSCQEKYQTGNEARRSVEQLENGLKKERQIVPMVKHMKGYRHTGCQHFKGTICKIGAESTLGGSLHCLSNVQISLFPVNQLTLGFCRGYQEMSEEPYFVNCIDYESAVRLSRCLSSSINQRTLKWVSLFI